MCLKSRINPTITPVGFDIRLQYAAVRVVAGFPSPCKLPPSGGGVGLVIGIIFCSMLDFPYTKTKRKNGMNKMLFSPCKHCLFREAVGLVCSSNFSRKHDLTCTIIKQNQTKKKPFRMDETPSPCERAFWIVEHRENVPPIPKHLGAKIRNQTTKETFPMNP